MSDIGSDKGTCSCPEHVPFLTRARSRTRKEGVGLRRRRSPQETRHFACPISYFLGSFQLIVTAFVLDGQGVWKWDVRDRPG